MCVVVVAVVVAVVVVVVVAVCGLEQRVFCKKDQRQGANSL